jgi:hypothetical protein
MNSFIIYIFQVSLVFSVFYLIYKWLFSKLTFHGFNRSLLLLIIPLVLVLPIVNSLFPTISILSFELPLVEEFTTLTTFEETTMMSSKIQNESISVGFLIFCIYAIGLSIYLIRFLLTTYS